jgi:two-component system response regulator RstA
LRLYYHDSAYWPPAFITPYIMQPKVLLITDLPDFPRMGVQMLVLSGIEISVREHNIVKDKISAADVVGYDLLLINMYERESDSAGICWKLRTEYDNPILVLTHEEDEHFVLSAYDAGADDCLVQPMSNHILLAKVHAWLRRVQIRP